MVRSARKKEEGGITMRKMLRSLRSTLGKTIVLCALALTLLGGTSAAYDSQNRGGADKRKRDPLPLTFTQIDVPGATRTSANSINNRGQIVGGFVDAANVVHGFLLENGVFTQIDFPGAAGTEAFSINNRRQIVGGFVDASGPPSPANVPHGFLLENGVFTRIEVPGAMATIAYGINDRGQIAGLIADPGGAEHGFLLDGGVFTQIDVPGGVDTNPLGLNNRGQIVGHVGPVGAFHGFLLDNGVFTQIDFPGAAESAASGINDRGQTVGYFFDAVGAQHGFLASKEQFSGKAIGAGAEQAAVEIVGSFTSPTDLDLSAATLTITSLLNEQAGGGELVRGLPLVLTAVPGSHHNLALFVDRSHPNFASVTIQDVGSGKFIFKINVHNATINSPQKCSPTRLTISFRLDDASKPPTVVSTERSWSCFGPSNRFLETH
jgi:probable HAF family extracellular repeat protein